MAEFMMGNPENSPWWMSRLVWLMDSAPQLTLELWNSPKHEKLLRHLDEKAALATYLELNRFKGMPEDVKQEMLVHAICPPDAEKSESGLPEKTRMEILRWAKNSEFPNTLGEDARLVTITI